MQTSSAVQGKYVLATGEAAVRRLLALHSIYSPVGRRLLLQAGLRPGMRVADFGCGVGAVSMMLAQMVGPAGQVVGVDADSGQVEQARIACGKLGLRHAEFVEADACDSGLPRESFDVAYCRFLLIHLPDPAECLREMRAVLKPGGLLMIEDGDLASGGSYPETALNAFGDLFARLSPVRGVDYRLGRNLYAMVKAAGFRDVEIEIHQPAIPRGVNRNLLKWSVEEAAAGFVDAGLITQSALDGVLRDMQTAIDDPDVLVLCPRMSVVWARK